MQIIQIILPFWYLYLIILVLLAAGLIFIGIPRKVEDESTLDYEPKTLVMIPCRGVDYSLRENIASIADQDYSNFDIIAIVDEETDPSVDTIRELSIPCIITSAECDSCSGKVRALSTAIEKNPGYDVYVICDSDITVNREWLRNLVSPLADPQVGLSTTFPFFNPVGGFWSKIKAVWGIVGQSLMESRLTRFGWGGSLAFRKDLLDPESFRLFSESVSDDTALSSISSGKGLRISYSRKAQPTINSPDDFETFFEWSNRQTALSISATRRVFHFGLIVYISSILVFISAILLTLLYSDYFALLFLPTVLSIYNNARRSHRFFPLLVLITPVLPFLFLINLLVANSMDDIEWRGRTYRLQKKKT